MRMRIAFTSLLALAACAVVPRSAPSQEQFYARLRALCGHAYEGRVVTNDEADREMAAARLVIQVRNCSDDELRIPFHAGNDHGRVWVVSRNPASGLHLRHAHRRADGSEEAVSGYGGDTAGPGNPRRQDFPADQASRDLFVRQDAPASITNVWAIEIVPGRLLAYELRRPGRFFRAEFDLRAPAAAPPPPWGER